MSENANYPVRPWLFGADLDLERINGNRALLEILAPEMAEAILAWRDAVPQVVDPRTDAGRMLRSVAEKLRAIGAETTNVSLYKKWEQSDA